MKYFRSFPWGLQLLLFLLVIMTMAWFGTFMVLTFLPKFTGYSALQLEAIDEHSPASLINTALTVQGILSVFIFLVPAFVFSYLAHPSPKEYLGLRAPGKKMQIILVILLICGAMPVLQMIEGWISHINFGAKLKAEQAANDNMMNAFLTMSTFGTFLRSFLVMAIIPAFGEEFFFRGVMMRFAKKWSRTMVFPIVFTAIIFSYSHTNIYGYLSIFLAGVLLGVIYNLTGSLWCSIIAHMFFNGFQVILAYAGNSSPAVKTFLNSNDVPIYLVISGAILFSVSFYLLLKNKTPLPLDWTDDFPPSEPAEGEWDFMSKN